MNTLENAQPNILTFEAPASWNTRSLAPNGFECQITLRGCFLSGSDIFRVAVPVVWMILCIEN